MGRKIRLVLVLILVIMGFRDFALADGNKWITLEAEHPINYTEGVIHLKSLGIDTYDIIGLDLLIGNKRANVKYIISGENIKILEELQVNSEYGLRVITTSHKYLIKLKTKDLPNITKTGETIVVRVPAMPEKGFKWPYYLRIPSDTYRNFNDNKRNYLMVDMVNDNGRLEGLERKIKNNMLAGNGMSVGMAEATMTPLIIPIVPKSLAAYNAGEDSYDDNKRDDNLVYEHQLDRDTAILKELLKDPKIGKELKASYSDLGYNAEDFIDIPKQIIAMIDHAISYLNKHAYNMENTVIMNGFSASGEFANRLTLLYPEKVKMMISGGAMEGTIIPLGSYKGEDLIFPIGISDYEKIVGRKFNLEEQNKVARLTYMGKIDTNDPLLYHDAYGNIERGILQRLFGTELHGRISKIKKTYKNAGGKGVFIYVKDTGHSLSQGILEYIIQFIKDNKDSDNPVYNIKVEDIYMNELEIEIY